MESLNSTSKETEESIKNVQEDLQKYRAYLDENKRDLLKEAFRANTLMGNVLLAVADELADEKDIFIVVDLEDEHRMVRVIMLNKNECYE